MFALRIIICNFTLYITISIDAISIHLLLLKLLLVNIFYITFFIYID